MSLAAPEDAASVLEQFVHDVANIPAEISHLMEEIQAKDLQIATYKDEINKRDAQLQKWVRLNGGHVQNPKEEAFSKTINEYYDRCEILQAEKCGLSQKAMIVLDRQIKRLDVGLRGLAQTEQFPSDWMGPSLLTASGAATGVSTPATGGGGAVASGLPLQVVSGNIGSVGGAPNIANAAQLRLAQQATASNRGTASGAQTPTSVARSQREGSSEANKRRRIGPGPLGALPASSLRQSSLGPGTPKAGTPGPAATSSRAGSAQPSRPPMNQKKAGSALPSRKAAPPPSKKSRSRPSGANKKNRHRHLARDRATPSTNASLSGSDDEEATSPTPSSTQRSQLGGERGEDENDDDETLYCLCQKVSFGDMVGCDNDDCEYQWFHYKCVGVTEEPKGQWLCPKCRQLPRKQLNITKD